MMGYIELDLQIWITVITLFTPLHAVPGQLQQI
jgi:hypothetical protein